MKNDFFGINQKPAVPDRMAPGTAVKSIRPWLNKLRDAVGAKTLSLGGSVFRRSPDATPFEISAGGDTIKVETGKWTRNAGIKTLATDVDETFFSITAAESGSFQASTDYYVYLVLEATNRDPSFSPDSVVVKADIAYPFASDGVQTTGNIYWMLGTISTNADTRFTTPTQDWTGGDIDDTSIVADSLSAFATVYRSIGLRGGNDTNTGKLQIFGWDTATATGSDLNDADLFPYQPSANDHQLDYISLEQISDKTAADLLLNDDWLGGIIDWINDGGGIDDKKAQHTVLDFVSDVAAGVGKSNGNTDHDDTYWRAFLTGFIDSKTFKTSGLVASTNVATGSVAAAISATLGGIYSHLTALASAFQLHTAGTPDVDNLWNVSTLLAKTSGLISVETVDGAITIEAKGAANDLNLLSAAGDVKITSDDDTDIEASESFIVNASTSIDMNTGGFANISAASYVNLDPTGDFKINGTAGWSGTFQVTQGGVTKDVTVTKGIITNVA